ncbi:glycosyltransferase [Methylomagnum sp.]
MSECCPLGAYAFDGLLVLYWRRTEKLSEEVNIFLNNVRLERPLLGVEFADHPDYLLAAYVPEFHVERSFSIKITTLDAKILAEANYRVARPLPESLVAKWSLANKVRAEKAFIGQLGVIFPKLGLDTRIEVAATLSEKNLTVFRGPSDFYYFRLPWVNSAEPGLLDATLKTFCKVADGGFAEPVKVLLDGGYGHFFFSKAKPLHQGDELYLLEAGNLRCVPFKLTNLNESGAQSLDVWVDEILSIYNGNKEVFRGYAGMVLKPPALSQKKRRLLGKVEGIRTGQVIGWALDGARSNHVVRLSVVIDGVKEDEVDAHLPRPDFKSQGYGNCGFIWQPEPHWMGGESHEIGIFCVDTGEELDGSPLRIGWGEYDGSFLLDTEGNVVGWIQERSTFQNEAHVILLVDGERHTKVSANLSVQGDAESSDTDWVNRRGFFAALPDRVFDTQEHTIEIEIANNRGQVFRLDRIIRIKANYRGHIDVHGPDRIAGWVFNSIAPERPVTLDLKVNGVTVSSAKAELPRPDVSNTENNGTTGAGRKCGFEMAVPPSDISTASITLDICLAGTDTKVFGQSVLHTPYDIAIRSLTTLAEILNEDQRWKHLAGGLSAGEDVTSWLRSQIITRLLSELRKAKRIPGQINLPLSSEVRLPYRAPREPIIDVIVPVYMGREYSLDCVESVVASACGVPMELVVINDASPDPELNAALRRLAASHGFLLLENKTNLGFVGTVNRGMRLHPGRDVVLLNSDTVVTDGWLDRLNKAACSANNIGTVTPFSNNATICSFPEFCRDNLLPQGITQGELDSYFARFNAGETVDVPTAVGFCMYIKRDALDEVGYFDEGLWGKGYGEENDFCLRSSAMGWRHVVACDLFIAHRGGASFGDKKKQQVNANLAKLNAIYPDYASTIQRFIHQDPLTEARNRVVKALLKRRSDRYILFLIHGLGGGTQLAADQLAARLIDEGMATLELKALTPKRWRLGALNQDYALYYRYPQDFGKLLEDLRELGIWHVHFHHTMGFPRRIWALPAEFGVEYDFTAHDYLAICPRINMIDESGEYCQEAQYSADTCTRCAKINGLHDGVAEQYEEFGSHVAEWRSIHGDFIRQARRVFAPSRDAATRFGRHFEPVNLRVEPHLEEFSIPPEGVRRSDNHTVAVIGAIGIHKGYDILLRCVRNAEKDGLPLKFVVIGYTSNNEGLLKYGNITITGEYRQGELPELIKQSGATVALFLSPWPETYSYTLSEAWKNGLYPVAFDIGAIAERIKEANYGCLMPLTSDPKIINHTLLEILAQDKEVPGVSMQSSNAPSVVADYYGFDTVNAEPSRNVGAG